MKVKKKNIRCFLCTIDAAEILSGTPNEVYEKIKNIIERHDDHTNHRFLFDDQTCEIKLYANREETSEEFKKRIQENTKMSKEKNIQDKKLQKLIDTKDIQGIKDFFNYE